MKHGKILSIGQNKIGKLSSVFCSFYKTLTRNGYEGIGKPEPLKGDLSGFGAEE